MMRIKRRRRKDKKEREEEKDSTTLIRNNNNNDETVGSTRIVICMRPYAIKAWATNILSLSIVLSTKDHCCIFFNK